MLSKFNKIIGVLSLSERKKIPKILILLVLMSILDMLSVAIVFPFVSFATNPDTLFENAYIAELNGLGLWVDERSFFVVFGFFIMILFFLSLIVKLTTQKKLLKFIRGCEFRLSVKLAEIYLKKSYSWIIGRKSSDLGKMILSEVSNYISNSLSPLLSLVTHITSAFAIIIALFFIEPRVATIVLLSIMGIYSTVYVVFKKSFARMGKDRVGANRDRYKNIHQSFDSPKETKFLNLESYFIGEIHQSAKRYSLLQATYLYYSSIPKYLIETLLFSSLVLAVMWLMSVQGDIQTSIPIIATYAFAAYRLMPSFNSIYNAVSSIKYGEASFLLLLDELSHKTESVNNDSQVIEYNMNLKLEDISLRYDNSNKFALKNISFEIVKGKSIGVVGFTGSGKTTLIDVICGLLEPTSGEIYIDGKVGNLYNNSHWQRRIGYVPQNVHIIDGTLLENICFGSENVDLERVHDVVKIAGLDGFVSGNRDNLDILVGEKGRKISGGQSQRIGLARALYRDPDVLVLDEATSALDAVTEKKIMDEIYMYNKYITKIIIAHRTSTLKQCDQIIAIYNGEISEVGSFDELRASNGILNEMIKANEK